MIKTIKEWVNSDVKKLKKKGVKEISTLHFFRDPIRPNFIDSNLIFPSTDGTIMHHKIVEDPTEPILEVKGLKYTLQDVLCDPDYNKPSIVLEIFLSFYDVHVARIPYSGFLKYKYTDPIKSYNLPMLEVEQSLLKQMVNHEAMIPYLKNNEKLIAEIYNPRLNYKYYTALIADQDVDVIAIFNTDQNEYYQTNNRFAQIRYGSQSTLILPLDERFDFEFLIEPHVHIETVDPLFKIHKK